MEHDGPPEQLGPYRVMEQIGAGGMGAVYRARDTRLEREVAIKVLHRHLEMAGAHERFLREARAVSSLSHANICTIFDIGDHDGDPYLVMELLHGESLKDRMSYEPVMNGPELREISTQVAMALAAAHAKGIVHRDIKPANLFLQDTDDGSICVKVLDFGLAKIEQDTLLGGDTGGLTRTGSTVGTVEYMSPEQARGLSLDPRSDLFSLGAVMYEMATGDVPFRGATSAVVFAELLGMEPKAPRSSNTHVSVAMDATIRKLLRKNREERTQSANALIVELKSGEAPVAAAPVRPVRVDPRDSASRIERRLSGPNSKPPSGVPERRARVEVSDPSARPVRQTPAGSRMTGAHPREGVRVNTAGNGMSSREIRRASGTSKATVTTAAASREVSVAADATEAKSRWWIPALIVAVLAIGAGAYFFLSRSTGSSSQSVINGSLQITRFRNGTGDALLQDTPAEAMQILLAESPSIQLEGYAPPAGEEVAPKVLAERNDAAGFLTGTVTREGSRYRVHAEIIRTADGMSLAAEDADAGSLPELSSAFSRLALQLRGHLGESPDQANTAAVPLDVEATKSLAALDFYGKAMSQLRTGSTQAAVDGLTKAVAEDPTFAVARMDLADALRSSGANAEAGVVLEPLRSGSRSASVCGQARLQYLLAVGDGTAEAAQKWATACPLAPNAQIALARELLTVGRGNDAEAAGNRAVTLDPANRMAYSAATVAMLAQDHYESALKEQRKAATLQVSSPGLTLLAAFLRGDAVAEKQALGIASASPEWEDEWSYVTYLSNRGNLPDAQRVAIAAAMRAESSRSVSSAGALLRARMASIQAMAGHCDANSIAPYASPATSPATHFYSVLASAWCHRSNIEAASGPGATPTLERAALAWGSGDAAAALTLLGNARAGEQATIAAVIRGESHLKQKQQVVAIGDFQAAITKRGSGFMTGTLAYPAAQAGLATAYSSMGDTPNATRVQGNLQTLWSTASPTEPLLRRSSLAR